MRGFLVLLAVICPLVLISPSFWSLVGMEFASTPVTYFYADGSSQRAQLGPNAPWPEWALRPQGARFTVETWYEETVANPGMGLGDFRLADNDVPTAVARFVSALRDAGWVVESSLVRGVLPDIPPRAFETCVIKASRDGSDQRVLQASFVLQPEAGTGSVQWATKPQPRWANRSSGPC